MGSGLKKIHQTKDSFLKHENSFKKGSGSLTPSRQIVCQIRQYQWLINIEKGCTWDEVPKTGNHTNSSAYF